MLTEQRTKSSTVRSEERARQKLAGVLERTLTLDTVPVSALYDNIVLDLVQYLDRPASVAGPTSPAPPGDRAEGVGERPPAVEEVAAGLLSLAGAPFSG